MKTAAIAALLVALSATTALAGQCQDDLKKVDRALSAAELAPDRRAEAQDMRDQAAQLCKAGNEQEGLDVLTEAKAMLSIE